MMERQIAIRVENLNKEYIVYDKPIDMLWEILSKKKRRRSKVVLDDINFQIAKGDVVGIIGKNGAGKSTLLKIISGILDYTSGKITVNGKISAILELGTGFHPEYSGRENIIMGGMCLGMSRKEMEEKSQSIIEFSELEKVIDEPFRSYSSGMKSRLTFSTAISVEPDIFIVDEALAAGDAVFVSKCLRRMKEICESGATVLFVSHSIDLVKRLCGKALYLEDGRVKLFGDVMTVCTEYEMEILNREAEFNSIRAESQGKKAETEVMSITGIKTLGSELQSKKNFIQHEKCMIEVMVFCNQPVISPAILIKWTRYDGILVTSWMNIEEKELDIGNLEQGENKLLLEVSDLMLGDGDYFVSVYFFEHREGVDTAFYADPLCVWENVISIKVRRKGRPLSTFFDQEINCIKVDNQHGEKIYKR